MTDVLCIRPAVGQEVPRPSILIHVHCMESHTHTTNGREVLLSGWLDLEFGWAKHCVIAHAHSLTLLESVAAAAEVNKRMGG